MLLEHHVNTLCQSAAQVYAAHVFAGCYTRQDWQRQNVVIGNELYENVSQACSPLQRHTVLGRGSKFGANVKEKKRIHGHGEIKTPGRVGGG